MSERVAQVSVSERVPEVGVSERVPEVSVSERVPEVGVRMVAVPVEVIMMIKIIPARQYEQVEKAHGAVQDEAAKKAHCAPLMVRCRMRLSRKLNSGQSRKLMVAVVGHLGKKPGGYCMLWN